MIRVLLLLFACGLAYAEPPLPGGLDEPADRDDRAQQAEPALPGGLSDEPSLPGGLERDGAEPALPGGLGRQAAAEDRATQTVEFGLPANLSGFWEARQGARLQDDPLQKRASVSESRLQLSWRGYAGRGSAGLTADLVWDQVEADHDVDLQTGQGWFDLREAWLQSPVGERIDIKAGRQVLTWGVGDLLFLNDLFPKDWNSFFAGRDQEYLKAPSDALRLAAYLPGVNVDLVVTPEFDADRFIDGRRISWFDPQRGAPSGRGRIVQPEDSDDAEYALRLYRQFGAFEGALYGYDGFWKSPAGQDPQSGRATHPALRVLGASLRGPRGPGIVTAETAHYESRDDGDGANPLVANGEWRALLGYEMELASNLTGAAQWYYERLLDYDAYRSSLAGSPYLRDRHRHLLTTRLTWLRMNQNLELSLFAFLSPTDRDAYLRPRVSYQVDDHLSVEAGGNLFAGERAWSFFGQFEKASNAYVALRYGF